jgi:hypothetical protein
LSPFSLDAANVLDSPEPFSLIKIKTADGGEHVQVIPKDPAERARWFVGGASHNPRIWFVRNDRGDESLFLNVEWVKFFR